MFLFFINIGYCQTAKDYNDRGAQKFNDGNISGAISDFSKSIELNPRDADVYYNRGVAKAQLSDYRGALYDYQKALDINPKCTYIYSHRGFSKYYLKDYTGAVLDFTKAIDNDPMDHGSYNLRGLAKVRLNDYNGAISDYTKAIEIRPNFELNYLSRGDIKFEIKNYKEAISDFSRVIEIDPNSIFASRAFYKRGLSKIEIGQNESGCSDLYKARELGHSGADEAINKYCEYLPDKQQSGSEKESYKSKPKFDPNKPFEVVPDITTDYDLFVPEITADNYGYIGDKGLKGGFQIDKIKVGNSYIELPFPSGFVKVDDSMGNLLEAAKKLCPETNTLLAYYLSEEDYANYLVDENHICEKYILVEVFNELKEIKVGTKDYRQFLKKHKDEYIDEFKLKIDDAEIKASENLSEIDERLRMKDFKMEPFGICYESKYSLSYGILTKYNFTIDYENSGDYIVAVISTITKIDSKPIFLFIYKKYNRSEDIQSIKTINTSLIEEIDKRQSPGSFLAEIDFEDYKESILAIITLSFIWAIYFATKRIHRKLKNSSEKKVAKVEENNELLDFNELLHEEVKINDEPADEEKVIDSQIQLESPNASFKLSNYELLKVNRTTRFFHFVIDLFFAYIFSFLVGYLFGALQLAHLVVENQYLFGAMVIFIFFFFQEFFFGKTIGKFITKTSVVDKTGNRPSLTLLIIRNISRLIPFDALTYLSKEKRGLHDIFSTTYVIKD